jgi:hypothetical protein
VKLARQKKGMLIFENLCLHSVIELVASDLEHACKESDTCFTLNAIVEIFDPVTGYHETGHENDRQLYLKFRNVNNQFLGKYLLGKASICLLEYEELGRSSTYFHLFHLINRILGFVADYCFIWLSQMEYSDSIAIARAAMIIVLSLNEIKLVSLSDDVIDTCRLAEKIFYKDSENTFIGLNQEVYERMTEFNELHREVVLKLMHVSSSEIKMLALTELTSKSCAESLRRWYILILLITIICCLLQKRLK